jgi:glycosyltransferase involved in cell wall biosynthesis
MRIAIVTAGGAGMFCGSCMHDNSWARGLLERGLDVTLIPTYTPIRVDGADVSVTRVFLGGLNVYLNARFPFWRVVPKFIRNWFDNPAVIGWATRGAVSNDARELGELTLSMLSGSAGPQREAGAELARYIGQELQPDVVIFSNALLAGVVPQLREEYRGLLLCTLQGDDVFLDGLPEEYRGRVTARISELASGFDGFLTHTHFYRDYMAAYLGLPRERFHKLPLGIDLTGHSPTRAAVAARPFTVGYFARIAPEKGLQHLVAAFPLLKELIPEARLRIGGYLPPQHSDFLSAQLKQLDAFAGDVEYIGSPASLPEKVRFYHSIDLLSVPTEFLEPKGLYVLEAWANGLPVVQPAHGAFPELLDFSGAGRLVPPRNPPALAAALAELADHELRAELGRRGRQAVEDEHAQPVAAEKTRELLVRLLQEVTPVSS